MRTTILIARHGNTFKPDQIPTRIGGKTDLPLVENALSINLGKYLKAEKLIPSVIFAAPLQRTMQTAELVRDLLDPKIQIIATPQFIEIDYGPDENKTEAEVELRLGKYVMTQDLGLPQNLNDTELRNLGKNVIDAWNNNAIVPPGWRVDPNACIQTWRNFADLVEDQYVNQIVLVIASNGIIRFAPNLTQDFAGFTSKYKIKVATGNLCIFSKSPIEEHWECNAWDLQPTIS